MSHNNRKRRKRPSLFFLLQFVVISLLLLTHSTFADEDDYGDDNDDVANGGNSLAPNLNCFSLVDENSWPDVLKLNSRTGVLAVELSNAGQRVLTCLQDQLNDRANLHYSLMLWRKNAHHREVKFDQCSVKLSDWLSRSGSEVVSDDNANNEATFGTQNCREFNFVLLKGEYRVRFQSCDPTNVLNATTKSPIDRMSLTSTSSSVLRCDESNEVVSDVVNVDETSPIVDDESWCFGEPHEVEANEVKRDPPHVDQTSSSITFRFEYLPCFDDALKNEAAFVTLYSLPENFVRRNRSLESATLKGDCFEERDGASKFLEKKVPISREFDETTSTQMSVLVVETPSLPGDHYYCLSVDSDHLVCRPEVENFFSHNNATASHSDDHPIRHANKRHIIATNRRLNFCRFGSDPILVSSSKPWLAQFLPMCTSHFACAWIYITVAGLAVLVVSCLLAILCIYCCCRSTPRHFKNHHHHVPTDDQHTFDTLCLADIKPKKTWLEVHEEFYREPPKNPGKILLLYSPDSKVFKDLQQSFRSFLELACHCVVLDLFDEELFQNIAYDPEAWLFNLLQDDKFKIVIICSENAFKRQQALLKGEVLNIPDVNSSLDGLFSAGLRFIQEQHAYDYHRLALVRYESLALTSPEFKLQDMVPNREFLVPSQLHDLFCWIHDHDPLDLLGKPWDRFHLELQLLQDSLKQARLDRRYV